MNDDAFPTTSLRIELIRSGPTAEFSGFLSAFETAYVHVSSFHSWVKDVEENLEDWTDWEHYTNGMRRVTRIPEGWSPELPPDIFGRVDFPLYNSATGFASPGFWEFFGALNPLETIRKYIAERHERVKDRDWRDQLEAQKLSIELEKLRLDVVAKEVELLQRAGIPKTLVRRAVIAHISVPLKQLDIFGRDGLLGGVLDRDRLPHSDT